MIHLMNRSSRRASFNDANVNVSVFCYLTTILSINLFLFDLRSYTSPFATYTGTTVDNNLIQCRFWETPTFFSLLYPNYLLLFTKKRQTQNRRSYEKDSSHSIFLDVSKKNEYPNHWTPNYPFQRSQTELVVHQINLLSTVLLKKREEDGFFYLPL